MTAHVRSIHRSQSWRPIYTIRLYFFLTISPTIMVGAIGVLIADRVIAD